MRGAAKRQACIPSWDLVALLQALIRDRSRERDLAKTHESADIPTAGAHVGGHEMNLMTR